MSSIGPQLPPHLQSPSKRKSPPSNSPSPPAKRLANTNEIDLEDSSSDDDYGPKAPAPVVQSNTAAAAPEAKNTDEIDLDSDSEDDVGPAPPPAPAAQGPAPAGRGPATAPQDEDSSSGDDYGPSLPSATTKARIGPSLPPSAAEEDTAPKRDDWMLAPPPSGPMNITDPTKISARSFSSKPGPAKPSNSNAPSIWTETPEEKLARLQASVLGKSEPETSAPSSSSRSGQTGGAQEKDSRIKQNVEAARGKSMVEEAREKRKKGGKTDEGDDDPSKRAFDREKDMAIGGRFGGKERREMMESAKDTSRFSKGTFL